MPRAKTLFISSGLAAILLVVPHAGVAQDGWSVGGGLVLARDLTHSGGPSLGALGGEVHVFAPPRGRWRPGGAVSYHRLGRFQNPVPGHYRDDSLLALGARVRRLDALAAGVYAEGGADLILAMSKPSDAGTSRDPGIGANLGAGVQSGGSGAALFAALRLHVVGVGGEATDLEGVYLTAGVGILF